MHISKFSPNEVELSENNKVIKVLKCDDSREFDYSHLKDIVEFDENFCKKQFTNDTKCDTI